MRCWRTASVRSQVAISNPPAAGPSLAPSSSHGGTTTRELTLESLREHLDEVFDLTGATAIPDPLEGEYAHLVEPLPYTPPPAPGGDGQGQIAGNSSCLIGLPTSSPSSRLKMWCGAPV